eukprot:2693271-Prymnesium_polylepis.1
MHASEASWRRHAHHGHKQAEASAISGNLWPSVAIYGHPWPSVAISGNLWPLKRSYSETVV